MTHSWCELIMGRVHLGLMECGELLWGDHLELAIGSDGIFDVRHAVSSLHSHRIEAWMHIHRWITIWRKWRLTVPHHLRIQIRWRTLKSMTRRGTIKTLISVCQLIVVQSLSLTRQTYLFRIRIHEVIGLHLFVFAHKCNWCQTRRLKELILVLSIFDKFKIWYLLLSFAQIYHLIVIFLEEILHLFFVLFFFYLDSLWYTLLLISSNFIRSYIFRIRILIIHDAHACISER